MSGSVGSDNAAAISGTIVGVLSASASWTYIHRHTVAVRRPVAHRVAARRDQAQTRVVSQEKGGYDLRKLSSAAAAGLQCRSARSGAVASWAE